MPSPRVEINKHGFTGVTDNFKNCLGNNSRLINKRSNTFTANLGTDIYAQNKDYFSFGNDRSMKNRSWDFTWQNKSNFINTMNNAVNKYTITAGASPQCKEEIFKKIATLINEANKLVSSFDRRLNNYLTQILLNLDSNYLIKEASNMVLFTTEIISEITPEELFKEFDSIIQGLRNKLLDIQHLLEQNSYMVANLSLAENGFVSRVISYPDVASEANPGMAVLYSIPGIIEPYQKIPKDYTPFPQHDNIPAIGILTKNTEDELLKHGCIVNTPQDINLCTWYTSDVNTYTASMIMENHSESMGSPMICLATMSEIDENLYGSQYLQIDQDHIMVAAKNTPIILNSTSTEGLYSTINIKPEFIAIYHKNSEENLPDNRLEITKKDVIISANTKVTINTVKENGVTIINNNLSVKQETPYINKTCLPSNIFSNNQICLDRHEYIQALINDKIARLKDHMATCVYPNKPTYPPIPAAAA